MSFEDKVLTLVTLIIVGLIVLCSLVIVAEKLPANQQRYNMAVNYEDPR